LGVVPSLLSISVISRSGGSRWARAEWSGMSPARHASDAQMDAATWCRHLVPDGSVYAFLADHSARSQREPPDRPMTEIDNNDGTTPNQPVPGA
jgi:hypothetical protein